jgi:hypothetical protein
MAWGSNSRSGESQRQPGMPVRFPSGFRSGNWLVKGVVGIAVSSVVPTGGRLVRRGGSSGIDDENLASSEIELGSLPGWFGAGPPFGWRGASIASLPPHEPLGTRLFWSARRMSQALPFLLLTTVAWLNRRQDDAIDDPRKENGILREKLGRKRISFTSSQRKRQEARAHSACGTRRGCHPRDDRALATHADRKKCDGSSRQETQT